MIPLWNLLPEVTADAGTVDEKLVKTFDRKICGRVLPKEFMESLCESPAENSWCGKAPRGSILTLLLFFLGQLLLIRAVERTLGWWALGASWWGCSEGMQAATCRANLGNRTRPELPGDEPPQSGCSSSPSSGCTESSSSRWHQSAWAEILAVITGMFPALS